MLTAIPPQLFRVLAFGVHLLSCVLFVRRIWGVNSLNLIIVIGAKGSLTFDFFVKKIEK